MSIQNPNSLPEKIELVTFIKRPMTLSQQNSAGDETCVSISIRPVQHYDDVVAGIYFKYNPTINSMLKKVDGCAVQP